MDSFDRGKWDFPSFTDRKNPDVQVTDFCKLADFLWNGANGAFNGFSTS